MANQKRSTQKCWIQNSSSEKQPTQNNCTQNWSVYTQLQNARLKKYRYADSQLNKKWNFSIITPTLGIK